MAQSFARLVKQQKEKNGNNFPLKAEWCLKDEFTASWNVAVKVADTHNIFINTLQRNTGVYAGRALSYNTREICQQTASYRTVRKNCNSVEESRKMNQIQAYICLESIYLYFPPSSQLL